MIGEKTSKLSFFMKLLIALALFVNEDIYVFGTIQSHTMVMIRQVVQIIIFVYLLCLTLSGSFILKKREFVLFVFFSLLVCTSAVINMDFRNGYLVLIMVFFISMALSVNISFEAIFDIYFNGMVFLCLASMIFYLLYEIAPGLISKLPLTNNVSDVPFYTGVIVNAPYVYDSFHRNYGAFREPGVFQAYINLALMYLFIKKEKVKYWKVIVLLLALITTFSTTGYLSFFMLVVALLYGKRREMGVFKNKSVKTITIIGIVIVLLYMYFFTDLLYNGGYGSVFGKLAGFTKSESKSTGARLASITVNIKMFFSHPIAGAGISYVDTMFTPICKELYNYEYKDNTNTLFIQLARFGIIYFSLMMFRYCYFFLKKYSKLGKIASISILCSFLLLLFGQTLSYSILFSLFLFYSPQKE